MRALILTRSLGDDQGTPGSLEGIGLALATLELPWRRNLPLISCIVPGKYRCRPVLSRKHGNCVSVLNVPDRADILIHAGNWAGNKARGHRSDSEGCILVGETSGELEGQRAVLHSRAAMGRLLEWMDGEECELEVIGGME